MMKGKQGVAKPSSCRRKMFLIPKMLFFSLQQNHMSANQNKMSERRSMQMKGKQGVTKPSSYRWTASLNPFMVLFSFKKITRLPIRIKCQSDDDYYRQTRSHQTLKLQTKNIFKSFMVLSLQQHHTSTNQSPNPPSSFRQNMSFSFMMFISLQQNYTSISQNKMSEKLSSCRRTVSLIPLMLFFSF
jgi:hypothetical protein